MKRSGFHDGAEEVPSVYCFLPSRDWDPRRYCPAGARQEEGVGETGEVQPLVSLLLVAGLAARLTLG